MGKGFSIADLLPKNKLVDFVTSVVEEGEVYRMKLDGREEIVGKDGADSRNKYFIVIGQDSEGNALGFFVVDTKINESLPQVRKDKHVKIEASKYAFLEGTDRYVDCSDFKMISKERFTELFSADKVKARILPEDIEKYKQEAVTYKNANKARLKRFGLLPIEEPRKNIEQSYTR